MDQLPIDEESLTTRAKEVWSDSVTGWDLVQKSWKRANDQYDGVFSDEEAEYSKVLGVKRLFIRKTWAQVQRIMADYMDAIYGDPDELINLMQNKAIPRVSQDIFKTLLNHRMRGNPINYYEETYEAGLDAIKNKACVLKVYPKFLIRKSEKKVVTAENAPDKSDAAEYDDEIEYFCPALECVPYEDVRFSSRATWKDYWRHPIIHRKPITRADAIDRGFKNIDQVDASGAINDEIKMQREEKSGSPFAPSNNSNKEMDQLFMYEVWDFRRKDGRLESGSFVMGGGSGGPDVVFRGWEWNNLPYRFDRIEPVRPPIVLGNAIPRSHELRGDSFCEVTEGLQMETNASVNQEREAVAMALRPPLIVAKDSGIDLFSLITRKIGAVMQSEIPPSEVARELTLNNPIPVSAPNRQRIDADYAEISSITPMTMGATRGSDMPATNFAGLSSNSNKKIQFIMRNIIMTAFIPALKMLMRLEQAYETNEYIEEVTGANLGFAFEKNADGSYAGASPLSSIQGEYAFEVGIGVNKMQQMGMWKTVIELINQANTASASLVQMGVAPPDQVRFMSPQVPIEVMLRTLGQKNIEELTIQATPPPVAPEGGSAGVASPASVSGMVTPAQEAMLAG